jgi:hypothetical protein
VLASAPVTAISPMSPSAWLSEIAPVALPEPSRMSPSCAASGAGVVA